LIFRQNFDVAFLHPWSSPTAAAAVKLLRSGMTLTEMYSEYIQKSTEVERLTAEYDRLTSCMDQARVPNWIPYPGYEKIGKFWPQFQIDGRKCYFQFLPKLSRLTGVDFYVRIGLINLPIFDRFSE